MRTLVRVLKWIGIVFVLLVFLSLPTFVVQIPINLAFGWIIFLRDNIARLTMNPLRVAEAAACIAALGLGGHFFARWLYGQMLPNAARAWRPGWTVAGLGAILLLFVAGVGTIGITHQTAWLLTDPGPLVENNLSSKRIKVSEAILTASGAKTLVGEIFVETGHLPTSEVALPSSEAESQRVRNISIGAGGVIQIELADEIQKGGVITLTPAPKGGTLEWKCHASNVQQRNLPSVCRN